MISRSYRASRLSISLTVICAAISSFSLSFIPLAFEVEKGKGIIAYLIAAAFWFGIVLAIIASFMTKKVLRKYHEKLINKKYIKNQVPGIVSFSLKWKNMILYSVTVVGLVLIITDVILGYVPEMIMFPIISVTVLSFTVHCVIDGKYYKVYKLIKESMKNETSH